VLAEELAEYNTELLAKPHIVIASKADLDEDGSAAEKFIQNLKSEDVILVSSYSGQGLDDLKREFVNVFKRQ